MRSAQMYAILATSSAKGFSIYATRFLCERLAGLETFILSVEAALDSSVNDMGNRDPQKRPTMDEAVLLEKIKSGR